MWLCVFRLVGGNMDKRCHVCGFDTECQVVFECDHRGALCEQCSECPGSIEECCKCYNHLCDLLSLYDMGGFSNNSNEVN